ncbi:unnamed protein product [Linum trigynum]|uniref:KIB1-4 beta-propeller domain-containing protein n=1 Tax=Linum trigynum TaxID=586398 RepID=A0AAV2G9L1_9ROSI
MALRLEPWLLYSHGKKKRSKTFYSLSEGNYHVSDVREMRHRMIYAHSHGWLVLVDQGECWLYNPSTTDEIQLPNFPKGHCAHHFSNCALSSDPKLEGSMVMFIHQYSDEPRFLYCKPGDVHWTVATVEGNCGSCGDRIYGYRAIASLGDEFYVHTVCCESLLKLQFNQFDDDKVVDDALISKIRLLDTKVRRPNCPRTYYLRGSADSTSFLAQLPSRPNELMIVEVDYGDHIVDDDSIKDIGFKGVGLYMANFEQGRWEDLGDLPDDCAIFLGSHPDNILVYNIPKEDLDAGIFRGNTVYFTQYKDGDHLYAYDVREKSISVCRLHCTNTKHCSEPQWILRLCRIHRRIKTPARPSNDAGGEKKKEIIMSSSLPEGRCINEGNPWCDIEIELLSRIQSRLFGADRSHFRLTCKTWQSAFSTTTYAFLKPTENPLARCRAHRSPILVHIGKDGELVNFFDPKTNSTTTLPLPGLKGARIDLPSQLMYDFEGIAFSSPPTSSDCTVLGYSVAPILALFRSLRRGQRKWTDSSERMKGIQFDNSFTNPVYHRGLFYFMGKNGNLCTYNPRPKKKQSRTLLSNLPTKPCAASIRRSHLMECDGKLLSVFTGHMGRSLQVYELHQDQGTMTWEEVASLEDKVLFLSSGSSLSSTSEDMESRSLGNKVFLDRFNGKDGVMHCLARRKFYTMWSGYKSDDWCDTKEYTNCAWVVPNFDTHKEEELRWAR